MNGRERACASGCASCYKTHKDIPVFPLELVESGAINIRGRHEGLPLGYIAGKNDGL